MISAGAWRGGHMAISKNVLWPVLVCSVLIALSQRAVGQEPQSLPNTAPDSKPTVCEEGCEFSDLNAAIRASSPGGIVSVAPGTYRTCGVIDKSLQLIGLKD